MDAEVKSLSEQTEAAKEELRDQIVEDRKNASESLAQLDEKTMEQLGKQAASLQEFKDESKQSLETQIEAANQSIDDLRKSAAGDLTRKATELSNRLDEMTEANTADVEDLRAKLKAQDAKTESLKNQLTAKDDDIEEALSAHKEDHA
jgi:hypothetical protein